MVIPLKVGFSPELLVQPLNPIDQAILVRLKAESRVSERTLNPISDRNPAAPALRGFNSSLFIGGALMRNPRAVPNLCKADSGLSAMIGILALRQ